MSRQPTLIGYGEACPLGIWGGILVIIVSLGCDRQTADLPSVDSRHVTVEPTRTPLVTDRTPSANKEQLLEENADNTGLGQPSPSAAHSMDDEKSLAELLLSDTDRELLNSGDARVAILADQPPEIDDQVIESQGIRKLTGTYLTLYTDLPPSFAVDELPRVFDAAVPLWCEYFLIPLSKVKDWKMTGYLIESPERHRGAGLLPDNLPDFLNGFQRGLEFWAYEPEGDYYRRHLILHEGVHGFMSYALQGTGPPWYREGMAELLATHRWKNRELTVAHMPESREEVPYWGRIKIIKDEYEQGRGLMIREVMRLGPQSYLGLDAYAWSWAVCAFLDGHPSYRNRFRELRRNVTETTAFFTRDFEHQFQNRLREMDEEWQVFIVNIDYGYDFRRNAVQYAAGLPLPEGGATVTIETNRGWQSTRWRVESGKTYRLMAKGRYQIHQSGSQPWWCEPGGITLRYAHGQPLGMLMGNVRLHEPQPGISNLGVPIPIGLTRRMVAQNDGTLYLKVNDFAGELQENTGQVIVKIIEEAGAPPPVTPETDQSIGLDSAD